MRRVTKHAKVVCASAAILALSLLAASLSYGQAPAPQGAGNLVGVWKTESSGPVAPIRFVLAFLPNGTYEGISSSVVGLPGFEHQALVVIKGRYRYANGQLSTEGDVVSMYDNGVLVSTMNGPPGTMPITWVNANRIMLEQAGNPPLTFTRTPR